MRNIWYLLKYPEDKRADCVNRCPEVISSGEMEEILCFQYQRMIRYGGKWHLEKRLALPGYMFVDGNKILVKEDVFLTPCQVPYLRDMCHEGSLIEMSRGIIRHGNVIVTDGPLKGREPLIRKIDRHKRTAVIEIPFEGGQKQITVGLEIYKKEM